VVTVYFEECNGRPESECHMITKQQFGEVEYTEGKAFMWGKYDDIVGLGFPKLAIDGTIPPFGENHSRDYSAYRWANLVSLSLVPGI
jgi:hypothetical protein